MMKWDELYGETKAVTVSRHDGGFVLQWRDALSQVSKSCICSAYEEVVNVLAHQLDWECDEGDEIKLDLPEPPDWD